MIPAGAKVAAHRGEIRTDLGWEGKTASAFSLRWMPPSGEKKAPIWSRLPPRAVHHLHGADRLPGMGLSIVLFSEIRKCASITCAATVSSEAEIIARAAEWWNRHVIADVPPAPTCDADVRSLFPTSTAGKTVEADAEVLSIFESMCVQGEGNGETVRRDRRRRAALVIKSALGDAEALTLNGNALVTWKSSKIAQRFDTSAFQGGAP